MQKIAFFDVDKTIFRGYSENILFEYIEKNNILRNHPYTKIMGINKKYANRELTYNDAVDNVIETIANSVKGETVEKMADVAGQVLKENEDLFEKWFFPVYDKLKKKDFKCVLISGATEIIIKNIAEYIDKDIEYYCTKLVIEDAKYTGAISVRMNGISKREIIENTEAYSKDVLTLGFGDSPGDIPMLEVVDHAFLFEQEDHPEMIEVAKDKGWTVFRDENTLLPIIEDL